MGEKKGTESRHTYKKPVFVQEEELVFPKEIIEKFNGGRLCVQCSSCHGCKS